ncbi:BA14K family protein [Kaistia dalseonensis]|uniref:Lectin-like protein BA14k n=1 Tax=Kaistia dalseonensis TaxID=410840 RepID=A0ABU0HBE7_9HYPH|nr:BA14K family protein [Kaistia dalseonensis]MCX5497014.1 BA14K family protein [Kaistia dalseonensis]MDQ0439640.1 hypothetical protein [Kaistia dalseonensis]
MFENVKKLAVCGLATALVATSALAIPSAAQAQPADGSFQLAQNWDRPNGWNGGGPRYHNGGPRYYGHGRYYGPRRGYTYRNGYYYNNNTGAAVAAGVIGLAAGAMIAGAANQDRYNNNVSYCSQRYRSYNPNTGTYTGYDGRQHPCP